MHIQSKLLYRTFVVALFLTWASPFVQDKKSWFWVGERIGYLVFFGGGGGGGGGLLDL